MVEAMSSFTLPSGRVVETHEPLFGEFVHVVSTTSANLEDLVYAKFAVIVPGMSKEEVAGLSSKDGIALLNEVGRIWDGRPEKEDVPLSNGSQPPFTVLSPESSTNLPQSG